MKSSTLPDIHDILKKQIDNTTNEHRRQVVIC